MKNPDLTDHEDAPHAEEAEIPGFGPSRRDQLDPPNPETTVSPGMSPVFTNETPGFDPPPYNQDDDELPDDDDPQQFEESPSTPPSSSRISTRKANPEIAAAAAGVFDLIARVVGLLLDRSVGKGSGAWVMRDEEAAGIAEPLGRIAARRVPVDAGEANDVADAIEAGVAGAVYATRSSIEQYTAPDAAQPGPGGAE